MVKTTFNTPAIDIFDPTLNKDNRAAYEWDEQFNKLDDQAQQSASEIRDRLGPRPNEVIIPRPEQTGIYVTLEDRAVALEGIVRYLNKANQVHGGLTGGQGSMRRRYGDDLDDVQAGAQRNRDKLIKEFLAGTNILAATDALRAYGYNEYQVEDRRVPVQAEIHQRIGVGIVHADVRNRVVKDARDTADVVAGRKQPRNDSSL